jgi:transglutaminase-like putative cysteine protease
MVYVISMATTCGLSDFQVDRNYRGVMLIRSEFNIQFSIGCSTSMIALLHLHPSLDPLLRSGNDLLIESHPMLAFGPAAAKDRSTIIIPSVDYTDAFGNRCARFDAPAGHLRLSGSNVVDADSNPDSIYEDAEQRAIKDLPSEVLQFLLPSRYCLVDQFGAVAQDLFGSIEPGWSRAVAIRDWVHDKVAFNYNAARPTKSAMDVFTERVGVCRDFQHLAITLSRCMNLPARYVTGYIGDIRSPYSGPGDFSAWYQVFLDGKWVNLDARHNYPRIGRILMASGRDAADVAITTSFGSAQLTYFFVESNEIGSQGNLVPLPRALDARPSRPEVNTPTQTNTSQPSPSQTQSATS